MLTQVSLLPSAPNLPWLSSHLFFIISYFLIAADQITKLLKEAGATSEKDSIEQLLKAVKGKKLHDLVREGSSKLATIAPVAAGNSCFLILQSLFPFSLFPQFLTLSFLNRRISCCCPSSSRRRSCKG